MDFGGTFGVGFSGSFSSGRYVPWWLAGGVAAGDCVAAYQAKGAASYAASKINLANPGTYNAADGTAYPTWNAATGWTFNGTMWLTTGIAPSVNMSMLVRYHNSSGAIGCLIGSRDTNWCDLWWQVSGGAGVQYGHGSYLNVTPSLASGVLGFAGQRGYRNGADDGVIGAGTGVPAVNMLIGARAQPTAANHYTGDILAISVYSVNITATQVAAITAAMQAL